MERLTCSLCGRGSKGLYPCTVCKQNACTKCFLDNLMMCKVCLKKA